MRKPKTYLRRSLRLRIESLESRLAPAQAIWTGASVAGTFLWSDAANWNRVGGGPIQSGDDLVFDNTGQAHLTSINNLTGDSFKSITISNTNGGYDLQALTGATTNAITLGSTTATGSLTVNTAGSNTIEFNIGFGGTSGNEIFNTILPSSVLTVTGQLSGPNAETLTKNGNGKLVLTNDNSAFHGSINDTAGILEIQNANGLGDTGAGFPTDTTHDTTVQANAQLDINIAAGATLKENVLLNGPGISPFGTLYNVAGSNTWAGNIRLGSDATIGVKNAADTLTVTGIVSDANAQALTKEGPGTLYLDPINTLTGNTYHGNTLINGGILKISQPFALGAGGASTTVAAGSTESGSLEVVYDPLTNTTGHAKIANQYLNFANQQDITLTGATAGKTLLTLNAGGASTAPITYTGVAATDIANIQTALDALSTIGGIDGTATVTSKTIAGGIVYSVVYAGNLAGVGLPLISGTVSGPGSVAVATSSNSTVVGFNVPNELLTLNGFGVAGLSVAPRQMTSRTGGPAPVAEVTGALNNQGGQNSWAQAVTFWTAANSIANFSSYYEPAVTIGAVANSSLTINGSIGDNNLGLTNFYSFSKVGNGRVILTAANTYTADIDILQGTLNVRDSNALGENAGLGKEAWFGTTLELQADSIPDSVPLAAKLPGQSQFDLLFPSINTVWLDGTGWDNEGALFNISGTNHIEGEVSLLTTVGTTVIKVAADPDPLNLRSNTWNDLSQLTIDGVIDTGELTKRGLGELVLTNANVYTGFALGEGSSQTFIDAGWVTVQNNQALGATGAAENNPALPGAAVADGASLVLDQDPEGNDLTLNYNLRLSGTGITNREPWLNQKGALLNLQGNNQETGNAVLNGVFTVGFEGTLAGKPLLDMTGNATGLGSGVEIVVRTVTPGGGNSNAIQNITILGLVTGGTFTLSMQNVATGVVTTTGPITWNADQATLVGKIQAALDAAAFAGAGNTVVTASNMVGIGVELDGSTVPSPFSQLLMTGQISDAYGPGEIIKLGSRRLTLEGDNIFTGGVEIRQGVLRILSDTALGSASVLAYTTVDNGAALEVAPTLPLATGGIERGLQVVDNHLILNGRGDVDFGDAALTVLADDNAWRGPITLNADLTVTFRGPAGNQAIPTMTAVTTTGAGTVTATTTTPGSTGSPGVDAVQTLNFTGFAAGNTFTLTVGNGASTATTGPIAWSSSTATLLGNIQAALNGGPVEALFTAGLSFALAALSSPLIDILPNSRFDVLGAIDDGGPAAPPADLFVSGGGEFLLGALDSYRGTTFVDQSTLTLANGQALGGNGIAGAQQLALTNPVVAATQFTLTYQNATTTPITYTGSDTDVAAIQAALNGLPTIGGLVVPGSVTVTAANPGVFLITFGGSLLGTTGPLLSSAVVSPAGTGSAVVVDDGATVVAAGAQLQLEGNITVSGEPLVLQGTGTGLEPTVQQVLIGGSNGVTGAQELSLANPIVGTTQFILGFNGAITNPIAYTGTNADAVAIQNALNSLNSIASVGGSVQVTPGSPGDYFIVFGGSLALSTQPLLISTVTSSAGTGVATVGNIGTFTLSFQNPVTRVNSTTGPLPINAPASALQSALNGLTAIQQGGAQVQTLTLTGATAATTYNLSFNGITTATPIAYTGNAATDAGALQAALNSLSSMASVGGSVTVTADSTDSVFTITFGGSLAGTFEPPLTAAIATGPGSTAIAQVTGGGSVSVFQSGVNLYTVIFNGTFAGLNQSLLSGVKEEQTVSFTGTTAATTYTVSFNSSPASATVAYTGDPYTDASNLQAAINNLPTVASVNGSVTVTPTSVPGQFDITYGGSLAGANQPILNVTITSAAGTGSALVTTAVDGAPGGLGGATLNVVTQIVGGTANATPAQWFNAGPAPIDNGETLGGGGGGGGPVTVVENFDSPTGANNQVLFTADPLFSATGVVPSGGDSTGDGAGDDGLIVKTINFAPYTGITTDQSGSGYFLFDGTNDTSTPSYAGTIWGTLTPITVTPNTNYTFSFYLTNDNGGPAAVIQPLVNGVALSAGVSAKGFYTDGVTGDQWQQFTFTWNSGTATTADLSLMHLASTWVGNDFGIDTIGFTAAGGGSVGTVAGLPVSGRITSIATDPSDANIMYVGTAGGGSWKTINGGETWTPLFDGINAVQTVTVQGTSGTFTLNYQGSTTDPLSYNATPEQVQAELNALPSVQSAGGSLSVTSTTVTGTSEVQQLDLSSLSPGSSTFNLKFKGSAVSTTISYTGTAADITSIENALDSLTTIGGLTPVPGSVQVSADSTFSLFTITFAGSLSQAPQGLIVAKEVAGTGTPKVSEATKGIVPTRTFTIVFSGGTFANMIVPTEQQIDLSALPLNSPAPAVNTFTLTFNGATTNPITDKPTGDDSTDIATELNKLPTIKGVGGSVTVTSPSQGIYIVEFGGTLAGTRQSLITATVATLGNFVVTELPTALPPITSTVVPASGNAKTTDQLVVNGTGTDTGMYVGAITLSGSDTIYLGTGESGNGTDGFAGTGVYESTDQGQTWSLLLNTNSNASFGPAPPPYALPPYKNFNPNPIAGLSVSQIVVDPLDPDTIYVATTDQNIENPPVTGATPGIYRYNSNAPAGSDMWFDLTGYVSQDRNLLNGTLGAPPNTPGPEDDFRMSFPQTGANWSDLTVTTAIDPNGDPLKAVTTLYAALGGGGGGSDAVFRTQTKNLDTTTAPLWYVGTAQAPVNQVEEVVIAFTNSSSATFNLGFAGAVTPTLSVATATDASIMAALEALPTVPAGSLAYTSTVVAGSITLDITFGGTLGGQAQPLIVVAGSFMFTSPDGVTVTLTTPGGGADNQSAGEFPAEGLFPSNGNIKIASTGGGGALTGVTLYAAVTNSFTNPIYYIEKSTDGGQTWNAATTPDAAYMGTFPYGVGDYASAIAISSPTNVVVGSVGDNLVGLPGSGPWVSADGGTTWKDEGTDADGNGPHIDVHALAFDANGNLIVATDGGLFRLDTTGLWDDINGNLAITQFNSIDVNPNDITQATGASQNNGIESYTGSQDWVHTEDGTGDQVAYDIHNPKIVYESSQQQNGTFPNGTVLKMSTDGGATWPTTIMSNISSFALDPMSETRLLVGAGGSLEESIDSGGTFADLNAPFAPTLIAAAVYQGTFQADAAFSSVKDVGANTYVPDTIYISDGKNISVTKNHGLSWDDRSGTFGGPITDLEVDPRDRDTVYVTIGGYLGAKSHVYMSTDAGETWTAVGTGLPDLPTWKLVLDPRDGDLYVGTDQGVYLLAGGTGTWQRFGDALAHVQVRDLVLNQSLNTLTAGTYGRSMYQFFLADSTSNTGALRSVAGSNIWTGPVTLTGDTTISANGSESLQNGVAAAELTINGVVSDLTPGANYQLTKIGGGEVHLGGSNTYGGITEVKEGVLAVDNPDALGSFTSEVQTLTVTQAAGTYTLAFNNVAATLTVGESASDVATALNALTTIAGAQGSVGVTLSGNVYTITFGGSFTGLDQPSLVSGNAANTVTTVANGSGATIVDVGAELGLESDLEAEPVILYGDGIPFNGHNTGALRDLSHDDTYTGILTLGSNSTIGVASGFSLTIGSEAGLNGVGTIDDAGQNFNLTKELTGTLILASANSYGGTTYVNQGALTVENDNALGGSAAGTVVLDGAQLQLQSPTAGAGLNVAGETLSLTGTGISMSGALVDAGGNNTWSGPISFDDNVAFAPGSTGNGTVYINVPNATDQLSLTGPISETLATGLTKLGSGQLVLAGNNSYTGTTYIDAGVVTAQSSNALGLNAGQEVQRITAKGKFTVAFNGQPIPPITLNSSSSAASVAAALNGIGTIGAGGVMVKADTSIAAPYTVFTITFVGANLANNQPQLVVAPVAGATAVLSTVADGSVGTLVTTGTALDLDGDPTHIGASITLPAAQTIVLNDTGVGATGALHNISGNNTILGNVTLATPTFINVDPTTTLTIGGIVQDTPNAPNLLPAVPASSATLDKIGTGSLIFSSNNTYTGDTNIDAGALQIQAAKGLGINTSTQENINVTGSKGSFFLGFTGYPNTVTTGQVQTVGLTASILQAALKTMLQNAASPGGGLGTAVVTPTASGTDYTVTFGGSLQGLLVPLLSVQNTVTNTTVVITQDKAGGTSQTIVADGAALQLGGSAGFTEASLKPLTINGLGVNNGGALENVSGSNTWGSLPITLGESSSIGADGSSTLILNQPLVESTPGLNVTKVGSGTVRYASSSSTSYTGTTTVAAGTLQLADTGGATAVVGPLTVGVPTPVSQVQTLTLSSFVTGDQFTLAYNGNTTVPVTYYGNPTYEAAAIQAALNLPALVGAGNTATVAITATPGVFTVTFGGTLAGTNPGNLITGAAIAPSAGTVGSTITTPGGTPVPASAIVTLQGNQQIASTANVVVNSDGKLDINNNTQTVTALTVNGGTVTTGSGASGGVLHLLTTLTSVDGAILLPGASSAITVQGLASLTGGTVTLGGTSSQLTLAGNLTATADSTGPATITGIGSVSLTSGTPTITVTGTAPLGLVDSAPITTSGGLTKAGTGRLELNLNAADNYGATTVTGGDVQVDAGTTLNNFILNGGSVSGSGSVGTIAGPSGAAIGTVNPGTNSGSAPVHGILTTTGDITWGATTTFSVDLNNASHPTQPTAGADYDQLAVTGNASIQGAILTGTTGAGTGVGDSFVILTTTGSVSGHFFKLIGGVPVEINQGDSVFIGTSKYTVQYNASSVVLTRTIETATIAITSSNGKTTSAYGEDVTFTATVTPEPQSALPASGATVTFIIDKGTANQHALAPVAVTDGSSTVTIDPQQLFGVWSVGDVHTIDATFTDTSDNFSSPVSATQFVDTVTKNVAALTGSVSPVSATTPAYGQALQITATVTPTAAIGVSGASNPTGSVVFTIDPGQATQQQFSVPITYQAPPTIETVVLSLPQLTNLLAPGTHTIELDYIGDPNFAASAASTFTVTVFQDSTTVAFSPAPASSNLGQSATFNVTVSPNAANSHGTPTGTVTLLDGSATIGSQAYTGATDTFTVPGLSIGTHSITATFTPSDGNYLTNSTTISYVVGKAATSTSFVNPPASANFNQPVTFTASVVANPTIAGFNAPSGTVTFWADAVGAGGVSLGTVALNTSTHLAVVTTTATALTQGTHTIFAVYSSDTNYATSTATLAAFPIVTQTSTAVTVPAGPIVYGTAALLTAKVTENPVGATPVSGHVDFYEDANLPADFLGSGTVGAGGTATYTTSAGQFGVGSHTIIAVFTDPTNAFGTSTGTSGALAVSQAGTTTSVTSSAGSSTFGQAVTFSVSVAPQSPAAGMTVPSGMVQFFVNGSTTAIGNVTLDGTGKGTFTTAALPANASPDAVVAKYVGDTTYKTSSNSINQTVNESATSVSLTATATSFSYASAVTFTVSVSAVSPGAGTPTGQVQFFLNGSSTAFASATLSGGTATLVPNPPLDVGAGQTLVAKYVSDGNYAANQNQLTLNISQATATTTLTSSKSSTVYGEPVTFTASAQLASTPALGQVQFLLGGTTLATKTLDSTGHATFTPSASSPLPVGVLSITAQFVATTDIAAGAAGATTETVTAADVDTAFTATPAGTSHFGQPVTFTAQVTPHAPSSSGITVQGTVVFSIDNVPQSAVTLTNGVAIFKTSTLSQSSLGHTITAQYQGDDPSTGFNVGTKPSLTQVVDAAQTTINVTQPATTPTYGTGFTYLVTISAVESGLPTPTGQVHLLLGATTLDTQTLVGGSATLHIPASEAAGLDTFTVAYDGDTNFSANSTSVSQTIDKAPVSVTQTITPSGSSTFGQTVTFSAVVTPTNGVAAVPAGTTVTFLVDGNPISTALGVDGSGQVSFTSSALTVGSHTLTASYAGDSNFAAQVSTGATQVVTAAPTSVGLTSDLTTGTVGDTINLTATVTASTAGLAIPTTTTVTFYDNGSPISSALPVDGTGQVIFSAVRLGGGSHTFKAVYAGNTSFATSTSPTTTTTLNAAATSMSFNAGASTSAYNKPITLNATITTSSAATPLLKGTVTFLVDGKTIGTASFGSSGVATLSIAALKPGAHQIKAVFSGNTSFEAAPTVAVTHTVTPPPGTGDPKKLIASVVSTKVTTLYDQFRATVRALDVYGNTATHLTGTAKLGVLRGPIGGLVFPKTATMKNGILSLPVIRATKAGTYLLQVTIGKFKITLTIKAHLSPKGRVVH